MSLDPEGGRRGGEGGRREEGRGEREERRERRKGRMRRAEGGGESWKFYYSMLHVHGIPPRTFFPLTVLGTSLPCLSCTCMFCSSSFSIHDRHTLSLLSEAS